MDAAGWTGWILAMVIACTQLAVALAALWRVVSVELRVEQVAGSLNGRLDMLLQERELRLRAEHQAEIERNRALTLGALAVPTRPEPVVREFPPAPPSTGGGGGAGPGPGRGENEGWID